MHVFNQIREIKETEARLKTENEERSVSVRKRAGCKMGCNVPPRDTKTPTQTIHQAVVSVTFKRVVEMLMHVSILHELVNQEPFLPD